MKVSQQRRRRIPKYKGKFHLSTIQEAERHIKLPAFLDANDQMSYKSVAILETKSRHHHRP
jgi:hypothetical protein